MQTGMPQCLRPVLMGSVDDMTRDIFIAVFVVMILAGALYTRLSDNRRRGDDSDTSWMSGSNSIECSVEHLSDLELAQRRAQRAIRDAGGMHVGNHETCVTGWVGKARSNIPQRAQFELAIVFERLPDGSVHFTCASRPRFRNTYFGASRSQELARLLANSIQRYEP
jgi:hypothetical protein